MSASASHEKVPDPRKNLQCRLVFRSAACNLYGQTTLGVSRWSHFQSHGEVENLSIHELFTYLCWAWLNSPEGWEELLSWKRKGETEMRDVQGYLLPLHGLL